MNAAALQPTTSSERMYRPRELAELLDVSVITIHRWEKSGILPRGRRFGRRVVRWTAGDIAPLLAERR
jgi:predicted DNA-binding transcriptional regulator AlpA